MTEPQLQIITVILVFYGLIATVALLIAGAGAAQRRKRR